MAYMVKFHVSSTISWILPADSVPPVPALLIILIESLLQPQDYLMAVPVDGNESKHSHVSLHIACHCDVNLDEDCFSFAVALAYQLVCWNMGFRDTPRSTRIWTQVRTNNRAGAILGERKSNRTAEAGRRSSYNGYTRSKAV